MVIDEDKEFGWPMIPFLVLLVVNSVCVCVGGRRPSCGQLIKFIQLFQFREILITWNRLELSRLDLIRCRRALHINSTFPLDTLVACGRHEFVLVEPWSSQSCPIMHGKEWLSIRLETAFFNYYLFLIYSFLINIF